jgi:protein translocase SecG subunit
MDTKTILLTVEIILAITFTILILIQPKSSGGLTKSWGSATSFTRRGLEQVIFKLTFVIAALFIVTSALQLVIH